MSFFEAPPPPPERPPSRQPEWVGPPDNALPGVFPLLLVLARTDRVVLTAHSGLAYPNGVAFTLSLRLREDFDPAYGGPLHRLHQLRGELTDDILRFGIRFPDGSKATIFDGPRHFASDNTPLAPVLMQRGGGGGSRSWDFGFWVWPLPPPGPLAFVCEWPSEQIALTEVEIETAAIRDAAQRAETLWPSDDGPSGSGGMIFSREV